MKRHLRLLRLVLPLLFALSALCATSADEKPRVTLDEFFNAVSFNAVRVSPDGRSVLIATERADWAQNFFRKDLWLYRQGDQGNSTLLQLTQSGHDSSPEWSPDGRWIAFLSDRKPATAKPAERSTEDSEEDKGAQLYLISVAGGEAFPVTQEDDSVHAFAWSADSATLYFAARVPWTKAQKDAYKKQWKDVVQYREAERGDTISSLTLADALARRTTAATEAPPEEKDTAGTPGAVKLATSSYRVAQLKTSPDGQWLALRTESISQRQEALDAFEIYLLGPLGSGGSGAKPELRKLTNNEGLEDDLRWAPDSRHIFFSLDTGSVEGKYEDRQRRVYSVDIQNGALSRWASDFAGAVESYDLSTQGGLCASGRIGTEVQIYSEAGAKDAFTRHTGWPGAYARLSLASHSPRVAFVFSSLQQPAEVYLAESPDQLQNARPITAFNKLFTERALPQGKPYRWTADDGATVEGMLIYPPGKFDSKHLPMFTLIHGGPMDADGDHFEADWYQWATLAAGDGWLVFEPNYRGSVGYGDTFTKRIVPEIVSRPGKDILEGIDVLVRDGIADPDRLTIGGYSYGGYMTNWLITQTTRFKAAVTGAGAVEHAANWGNDDTTFDDAYYLGGTPWEARQRYNDEAALWQIHKVRTPTHMVAGADDIRVAVLEDYLLERALHTLGVPSSLLIFPGEGHSLDKNPWHGKIKVREELKWLAKYGR